MKMVGVPEGTFDFWAAKVRHFFSRRKLNANGPPGLALVSGKGLSL